MEASPVCRGYRAAQPILREVYSLQGGLRSVWAGAGTDLASFTRTRCRTNSMIV